MFLHGGSFGNILQLGTGDSSVFDSDLGYRVYKLFSYPPLRYSVSHFPFNFWYIEWWNVKLNAALYVKTVMIRERN